MMNTTELAATLETTPRTLRKFLRSNDQGVGKGSRYALPSNKREIAKIRKAFAEWDEARTAKVETPAEVIETAPEVEDDTATDFDALENPMDA